MFRCEHQNILAPLLLLSLLWTSPSYSIDFSDCRHCHKAKPRLSGQYTHPGVVQMGCRVCHAEAHRQGAKGRLALSVNLPKLCFTCHEEKNFGGNIVHPPVGTGKCTVCHDPHSSDSPHLLRREIPALCYTCHKKFEKKLVEHWPVAINGCPLCHKPHASENRGLLIKPLNGLCLECHANIPKTSHVYGIFGRRHPLYLKDDPLNKGKEFTCLSCHAVHGSDSKKLLRFSVRDPLEFQLCNNCHHIY